MNLSTEQNRLMDIENRRMVAKGEEERGGMDWEFGVSWCKLLHFEWISNEVPITRGDQGKLAPVLGRMWKELEWEDAESPLFSILKFDDNSKFLFLEFNSKPQASKMWEIWADIVKSSD